MDWSSNPLFETAFALGQTHATANPDRQPLPSLLFLTDPDRTPEPWLQAARLPQGAGVIFRAFGRQDALETGRRLAGVCRQNQLTFLVGADADLAEALGADGLHLPERLVSQAPVLRRPGWLLSGAAHSARGLEAATAAGLDAALLSPVFPSASPSANTPLGAVTFARLVQSAGLPVFGLGGITAWTAPALRASGACGLAAVGAI